jgi:hypothetical protein
MVGAFMSSAVGRLVCQARSLSPIDDRDSPARMPLTVVLSFPLFRATMRIGSLALRIGKAIIPLIGIALTAVGIRPRRFGAGHLNAKYRGALAMFLNPAQSKG